MTPTTGGDNRGHRALFGGERDRVTVDFCTAKATTTGERCRRRASRGGTTCFKHGAAAPQVKAANARRVAAAEMMKQLRLLSVPEVGVDPGELLLRELGAMAGDQSGLRKQLESMPPEMLLGEMRGVLDLYLDRQQRLIRASEAAARLGLETHRSALAEQLASLLVGLTSALVIDSDLGLTADQRGRVRQIITAELRSGVGALTAKVIEG
jgi:hypothetical protein